VKLRNTKHKNLQLLNCYKSEGCNRATTVTTKLQRSNAAQSVDMLHWA